VQEKKNHAFAFDTTALIWLNENDFYLMDRFFSAFTFPASFRLTRTPAA
jgi:hypothetical protein